MSEKKKILIVEDEKSIAQVLAFNLMQAGYEYETAYDGADGLGKALSVPYDLILLDIMLPKLDGFEVCRRIRESSAVPIIMLTAREEEKDKIMGLDNGADDYITKPFSLAELLSRIRANIRRSSSEYVKGAADASPAAAPGSTDTQELKLRGLCIDETRYSVSKDGAAVELSKLEYDLLTFLVKNKGKPFSREELLEKVWGYSGYYGDAGTVDVTVSRLRRKLESDPAAPEYIMTKRGIGYYID